MALLVIVVSATTSCGCPEQFVPGALMTMGDTLEVLGNRPGLLYSLRGARRISDNEVAPVTLLSALVLEPNVDTWGSGSGVQTSCLTATVTLSWKLGHYQRGPFNLPDSKLVIRFNGQDGTATVGNDRFDTGSGNCFVIHLGPTWQAATTQTRLQYREPGDIASLAAFLRSNAGAVHEFAELRLYSELHPSEPKH